MLQRGASTGLQLRSKTGLRTAGTVHPQGLRIARAVLVEQQGAGRGHGDQVVSPVLGWG